MTIGEIERLTTDEIVDRLCDYLDLGIELGFYLDSEVKEIDALEYAYHKIISYSKGD